LESPSLIARCRTGDALAWEALVRRYQGRVLGLAVHYARDREEARDWAQDAFVRVYRKLGSYDGDDEQLLPWLLSVARNVCIDRLRRRRARPPAQDVPVEETSLADDTEDPLEATEREARRHLLHRAIARMGESHREMIVLKDIQGLKLEEIASMLGLPLGTVKSRSNRARVELATRIRELDPSYGA
jgi:RNA polymerase sigma-70 factor (ECF subfamily)